MKMKNMSDLQRGIFFAGICILAISIILLITSIFKIQSSEKLTDSYVSTIKTLIPEPQGAILEEQRDNDMPALSIEGTDFVGLLEMPEHSSMLPVGGNWKRPNKYPRCFSGSIYDGSIKIGGTTQKGQYDFYREISVGDEVYFTDMLGNRYGYTVKDIQYEKHADQSTLNQEKAALTLFIKNMYAFEYVIIFCNN